jgi:hypothetical protein
MNLAIFPLCFVAIQLSLFAPSASAAAVRTVALVGQPAPGLPSGVNFSQFNTVGPVINDAGQTAFASKVSGTGVDSTNDEVVWSEGLGSLAPVARSGNTSQAHPPALLTSILT